MNYILLILASGIFLWQCSNEQQESKKPQNPKTPKPLNRLLQIYY